MRVSVVMAVGPNQTHIREATDSLINQTFTDFETLVQTEKGLARARNEGFKRAQAEYVAIQDADDISYVDRFEKQVRYLDDHPEVSVVGSWGKRIGTRSGFCTPPANVTLAKLFMWDRVIHTSAMIRKADVMSFGPYRDTLFEDWDLWIRLAKAGKKIHNIRQPLVEFRFSKENHSDSISGYQWYREQILERVRCMW